MTPPLMELPMTPMKPEMVLSMNSTPYRRPVRFSDALGKHWSGCRLWAWLTAWVLVLGLPARGQELLPHQRYNNGDAMMLEYGFNGQAFAMLREDGSIAAWGDPNYGGKGAPLGTGFKALYSNRAAFAALHQDGSIAVWGLTSAGGTNGPVGKGFKAIYPGFDTFAAMRLDGSVVVWGNTNNLALTNVPQETGFTTVYPSEKAYAAMRPDGSIVPWGNPLTGGTNGPTGKGFKAIYRNVYAFAAMRPDGSIVPWGESKAGGANGPTGTGYTKVFAAQNAFAAMRPDGSFVTWGSPTLGGFGGPVGPGYKTVCVTKWAMAALHEDGSLVSWGNAIQGGTSTNGVSLAPTRKGFKALYSGMYGFAAVHEDESVDCWGTVTANIPAGSSKVKRVFLNSAAAAVLYEDGSIQVNGGANGPKGKGFKTIYVNTSAFAALADDGSILAWGNRLTGGTGAPGGGFVAGLTAWEDLLPMSPFLSAATVTQVTSTRASLSGALFKDGGSPVQSWGFVVSPTSAGRLGDPGVMAVPAVGPTHGFTALVTGLKPGTKYYLRSYATNSVGAGYSQAVGFTTLPGEPNQAPTQIAFTASPTADSRTTGTALGSLKALDANGDDTHTFALVAGSGDTDNAEFEVQGNQLVLKGVADYRVRHEYQVRLRATDSGIPSLLVEQNLTVSFPRANVAPVFTSSTFTVEENRTVIGTIQATDEDLPGQSLTYRISGGADAAFFAVDATTGQLSFGNAPNFELKSDANRDNVYEVVVQVSDNGTPIQSTSESLRVTVLDVNEGPILKVASSASYSEGSPATPVDPNLVVSDPESDWISSATVAITEGWTEGDQLSLTNSPTSLLAVYDANKGVLQLTGKAPLADYQTALRSLAYNSIARDALVTSKTRTLSWALTDAGAIPAASQVQTTTLVLTPIPTYVYFAETAAVATARPTLTLGTAFKTAPQATADNPGLLPNANLKVAGTAPNFTLTLSTQPQVTGEALVRVQGLSNNLPILRLLRVSVVPNPNYSWDFFAGATNGTTAGNANGPLSQATLNGPGPLVRNAQGDLYVAETLNHVIRKIAFDGTVSTWAGSPAQGAFLDGAGTISRFKSPSGLALDAAGNLYVADTGNQRIRKITPDGQVTTLAGTGTIGANNGPVLSATFNNPVGVAVSPDGLTVYVAEAGGNRIRSIQGQEVATLAGSGTAGSADGQGVVATFQNLDALTVDANGDLIAHQSSSAAGKAVARRVTRSGAVTTLGLTQAAKALAGTTLPLSGGEYLTALDSARLHWVGPNAAVEIGGQSGTKLVTGVGANAGFGGDLTSWALSPTEDLYASVSSKHQIRVGRPLPRLWNPGLQQTVQEGLLRFTNWNQKLGVVSTATDASGQPLPITYTLRVRNGTLGLGEATIPTGLKVDFLYDNMAVQFVGVTGDIQTLISSLTYRPDPGYFNSNTEGEDLKTAKVPLEILGITASNRYGSVTSSLAIQVLSKIHTPTLVNGSPVLQTTPVPVLPVVLKDAPLPNGPMDGSFRVSDLVDANGGLKNYSDPNQDAPAVALTGSVTTGSFYFSVDNQNTWASVGTLSASSSRVLFANARTWLYYQPAAGFVGKLNSALTFKAWDRQGGFTNGQSAVKITGTPFSTASVTVPLQIVSSGIAVPPQGGLATLGAPYELQVTAIGKDLTYQWMLEGALLPGQTNRTLSIPSVSLLDLGQYQVVVRHADGMQISLPTTVSVRDITLLGLGRNKEGQLGIGTRDSTNRPVVIATNVVSASSSAMFSLFAQADGTLWGMGINSFDPVGAIEATNRPLRITTNVVSVVTSRDSSLLVQADGSLAGMGSNAYGQLANGAITETNRPMPIATNVVSAAILENFSLFVGADGTLWGVGDNRNSQLGLASTPVREPVRIATNVVSAAAGRVSTLFVRADGTLWALGSNDQGQLGLGTVSYVTTPTLVATDVASVVAGFYSALFLKQDGTLWGMGRNAGMFNSDAGPLGLGSVNTVNVPTLVANDVVSMAITGFSAMFVKRDGTLWGMGANDVGQLGANVSTSGTRTPVSIPEVMPTRKLGGGSGSSTFVVGFLKLDVLLADQVVDQGGSLTWQPSLQGGMAPYRYQWQREGQDIPGATNATFTLSQARGADTGVYTVVVTDRSQLQVQSTAYLTVRLKIEAHPVGGLATLGQPFSLSMKLVDGASATYQWFKDRTLLVGQTNSSLQLPALRAQDAGSYWAMAQVGNSMVISRPAAVTLTGMDLWGVGQFPWDIGNGVLLKTNLATLLSSNVLSVSSGFASNSVNSSLNHALFLKTDGSLWGVGQNLAGQLGVGSTFTVTNIPVPVVPEAVSVVTGGDYSYFLQKDGTLWGMGNGSSGQLGLLSLETNLPVRVATEVASVAADASGALILKWDGTLWGVGPYASDVLGLGDVQQSNVPRLVARDVVLASTSPGHSLFVKRDGTLWSMGENRMGQLGNGTLIRTNRPVLVATEVVSISAADGVSLFVKRDGSAWAMGNNKNGQAGLGLLTSSPLPMQVATDVVAVSAGTKRSLFAKKDGTLWSSGDSSFGLGTARGSNDPKPFPGLGAMVLPPSGRDDYFLLVGFPLLRVIAGNPPLVAGQSGQLTTQVSGGLPPYTYQWSLEGQALPGATNADYDLGILGTNRLGTYTVVATDSQGRPGLGVVPAQSPLSISSQPEDAIRFPGQSNVFAMTLSGLNSSLSWRWEAFNNGQSMFSNKMAPFRPVALSRVGSVGNFYGVWAETNQGGIVRMIDNLLLNDGSEVTFRCTVTNVFGAVIVDSRKATLKMVAPVQVRLSDRTILWGAPVTWESFVKDGLPPFSYQWSRGTEILPGATNATLSFDSMGASEVGTYNLTVTDASGIPTSVTASLKLRPAITAPPVGGLIPLGQPYTLSVTAAGPDLTYQWFRDGVRCVGETNSSLKLPAVGVGQIGNYSVAIQSGKGLTLSTPVSVRLAGMELAAAGSASLGQLGLIPATDTNRFTAVTNEVVDMATGSQDSLLLMSDGTLMGMGLNAKLALGSDPKLKTLAPTPIPGFTNVAGMASAADHSLFFQNDGTLWAVGTNQYGKLGVVLTNAWGTTNQTRTPVAVASEVVAVAASQNHTLFLKADGSLWGMGFNARGSLGTPLATSVTVPQWVADQVVSMAVGTNHSLYVRTDGSLWGLGSNEFGQLGLPTALKTNAPAVRLADGVIAAAAGADFSLFLKSDGTLWGMGRNNMGQLGLGDVTSTNVPVVLATDVVSMTCGQLHSLFLRSDGSLWAMGWNLNGQLGDGSNLNSRQPKQISDVTVGRVVSGSVSAHTLVLQMPQTRVTLGDLSIQVGDRTHLLAQITQGYPPYQIQWQRAGQDIAGATNIGYPIDGAQLTQQGEYAVRVTDGLQRQTTAKAFLTVTPALLEQPIGGLATAGQPFTLSVKALGENLTYQWFRNGVLLPGKTNTTLNFSSVQITDVGSYSVAVLSESSLIHSRPVGLKLAGVRLLGAGAWGGAGYGDPRFVEVAKEVFSVSSGLQLHAYIDNQDALWAFGRTQNGAMGDGTNKFTMTKTPVRVAEGVASVSIGMDHTVFLKTDGTLWALGYDTFGQLGQGTRGNSTNRPTWVANDVVRITAGNNHTLFLKQDGSLWGMGDNASGQLGYQTTRAYSTRPVRITEGVLSVVTGLDQSLFLRRDGTLWGMGNNSRGGQLGLGLTLQSLIPVQVSPSASAMAAGSNFSLFTDSEGTLWGMGLNGYGQLGANVGASTDRPVRISQGVATVVTSYGSSHVLATKADGSLWIMGLNSLGQWGNGTRKTPPPSNLTLVPDIVASSGLACSGHASFVVGTFQPKVRVADATATIGADTQFEARVEGGSGSLQYQWQFHGEDIPGATQAILTRNAVTAAQAGPYTVQVIDSLGVKTTAIAQLQILSPPTLAALPAFQASSSGTVDLVLPGSPVADPDSQILKVTFTVSHGALVVAASEGITRGGTSLAPTLSGTVADLNRYLTTSGNLIFTPAPGTTGTDLTVLVSDGLLDASRSTVITPASGPSLRNRWNLAFTEHREGALFQAVGSRWTSRDLSRAWSAVASSAEGVRLVATVDNGFLYTSSDAGMTWSPREKERAWTGVASSADGNRLLASVSRGALYTSSDAGVTWSPTEKERDWRAVASSADGQVLVALASQDKIYVSTDSGDTWSARASVQDWSAVAISADGTHLAATVNGGQIHLSSDSGVTWSTQGATAIWTGIASSADGTRLIASTAGGHLHLSTDAGVTWSTREGEKTWYAVASNADGTRLAAAALGGSVFLSTDSGVTWSERGATRKWYALAFNRSGTQLLAAAYGGSLFVSNEEGLSLAHTGGELQTVTADLTVAHGILKVTPTTGVTVTGYGTASLHLTGPVGAVSATLQSLRYQGSTGYSGTETVQVVLSDSNQRQIQQDLVLSVKPLVVPTLAVISPTRSTTPVLSGTAEAGVDLTVWEGSTELGTVVVGSDGRWKWPLASPLSEGTHVLKASVLDWASGTPIESVDTSLIIDLTPPSLTLDTVAGDGVLTQPEYAALTTGTLDLTGTTTAEVDQKVAVVLNGKEYFATVVAGTGSANAFSLSIPGADAQALGHGSTYTWTAVVDDRAGNVSSQATQTLKIDIALPDVPTVVAVRTVSLRPSISGKAQKTLNGGSSYLPLSTGDQLTVNFRDQLYQLTLGGTSVPAGLTYDATTSQWALDLGSDLALTVPQNQWEVEVTVTTASGSKSDITHQEIVVDRRVPVLTFAVPAGDGVLNASEAALELMLTGTTDAGSGQTVTVAVGTRSYTASVDVEGVWLVKIPAADLAGVFHGSTQTLKASVSNLLGVAAQPATQTLLVDSQAPEAPTVVTPALTRQMLQEVKGKAEPGSHVTLWDGTQSLVTLTATAEGIWSYTPEKSWTEGQHTFAASATDAAGNTSANSDAVLTVFDFTAPQPPSLTELGLSRTTRPTLTGWSEAQSTVSILEGSDVLGTAIAGENGVWKFLPDTAWSEGNHKISAQATDAAGNVSVSSSPGTLFIDTLVPALVQFSSDRTQLGAGDVAVITLEFSEPLVGFSASRALKVWGDGTLGALTSTDRKIWQATFTPTPGKEGGSARIEVTANLLLVDVADNATPLTPPQAIDLKVETFVNQPPTVRTVDVSRLKRLSLKIPLAELASDPEGEPLVLSAVGQGSQGAAVTFSPQYFFYNPNPSETSTAVDIVTYTVKDARGATSTGTLRITVLDPQISVGLAQKITPGPNGTLKIQFAGVPGYNYRVERATDVEFTTGLQILGQVQAPDLGVFEVTDSDPPNSTGFYRIVWNPTQN